MPLHRIARIEAGFVIVKDVWLLFLKEHVQAGHCLSYNITYSIVRTEYSVHFVCPQLVLEIFQQTKTNKDLLKV